MFTDGVYDVVCPWLLASEEQKIYVNYVRLYMDMNVIKATSEEDFIILKENAESFLLSEYNSNITDDKTVAVVVNTDIIPPLQSGIVKKCAVEENPKSEIDRYQAA